MFRLLLLAVLSTLGHCADHNTFKDCARVDFCANLRNRAPEDKYVVDSSSVSVDNDASTISFTLTDKDGSGNLVLAISTLQDDTFRVKIKETDSTRYELQDVLDGEPEKAEFEIQDNDPGTKTITTNSGSNVVTVHYDPFKIEFAHDGVLESVLDGNRLVLQRDGGSSAFAFSVTFSPAVRIFGLHEHADRLDLQNTGSGGADPYRLRNLDVYNYELNSPMSLYGSVPVLYGHGSSATSGIFHHNAAQQWIETTHTDGGSTAYFMVESGTLDLFVFLGPNPTEVVRQYVKLTGPAHLPQLWTLGYHQSRYSYMSQDDVKDVIANFDSHNFQLDSIWLDIDYTNGKRYFTWNPDTYNDPVGMQEAIAATNKKLVTIIDPHIKVEQGYNVYDGALSQGLFVKNADSSVFQGECWPGASSYMDFLNPQARDYYASMYSYDNFQGSTPTLAGIWNDMNEPSVFDNNLEMTLPSDALHVGGVVHRDIHNIYGFLHTMSTHQGLLQRDNGEKRPFVLTRSHFAGSQRYAAIWTGDNTADWGYLAVSYAECLNANILGIVFCGADVGGFIGNPNEELFQRWYQSGAWLPFFRAHSSSDTNRREPYLFSDEVQNVIRNAIQLRYKHLPVWYTLFYEHTRNRDPIIRPLFYEYPSNAEVLDIDNQLLVGRDILVRAITEPGQQSVPVYFPGGDDQIWVSVNGGNVYTGTGSVEVPVDMQSIPVYYRGGSVIVRKDTVKPNTVEMVGDGHTLYVTLDKNNEAHGTAYIDDYTSFKYRDNAEYNYVRIDVAGDQVNITKVDDSNSFAFEFVVDQVVFNDVQKLPQNGNPGVYRKIIYDRDADGNLLRNFRLGSSKQTMLRFK